MIFRWRLTPLFVLAALLNPSDLPPDANHTLDMEDDGIPMELVNLWLDPIPPVLVINTPKVHHTLVTPRPRIDASGILQICIGDPTDVNTTNVEATTSTCDPTSSVYTLPVGIEETLGTQLSVSNKHPFSLKFRHRLKVILDWNLFFWLDILHWFLKPLVRHFRKKTPPTLASSVQIPRTELRQSEKGHTARKSKKRALRPRSKRSVVAKDDLCNLLNVLILGAQQGLEVDSLAQMQELKGTAENNKVDQVSKLPSCEETVADREIDKIVIPPGLDLSPGNVSEVLKTADTCANMDIIGSSPEMVISVEHLATTSKASPISTSNDAEASPYCRQKDAPGSPQKDINEGMTFEEQMRRNVPFLCTDDSDSESDDEEMATNAAIRVWIESQTSIKSSAKQIQSGMANLSESGHHQNSSVLPQPLHSDVSLASVCKISSAEALLGRPCVALGAKADNTGVVEEHGLEPGQSLNTSEPRLDVTGTPYEDVAPLQADESLDARGILAGYPKGWWIVSLVEEAELQALESGDLDFGFESFDVSELVAHLPETCYPRLMDVSIGAIERAEVVGDATEVGTTEIESEGDAPEISSTDAMSSLLEVETAEASSIHPGDSDAFIGTLNTSTQSIPPAETGSSQNEAPYEQNIEDSSTPQDEERQNEDSAPPVAEKSMDVQDILAGYPKGWWNPSLVEVSESETLQESGDLEFGFESFDVSELVAHLPETCYPRLMDVSIGAIERAEVVGDLTEAATAEIESQSDTLEMSSTAAILIDDIIDTTKEESEDIPIPLDTHDEKQDINVLASPEVDRSLEVCELMARYPADCWNQPLSQELAVQSSQSTSPGHLENSGDLDSALDSLNVAELNGKWPKGWRDPRGMDVSIGEIRRMTTVDDSVYDAPKVAGSLGRGAATEKDVASLVPMVKPINDRHVASKSQKSKTRKPLGCVTNKQKNSTIVAEASRSRQNIERDNSAVSKTSKKKTITKTNQHKIPPSGELASVTSVGVVDSAAAFETVEFSQSNSSSSNAVKSTSIIEQVKPANITGPRSCSDEDVKHVYIGSSKELKDVLDRMKPFFVGRETEDNWLKRQRSLDDIRGMLLTDVHVTLKRDFHKNLKAGVLECTLLGLASLRTTLSSKAAALYSELAISMGSSFDGALISIVLPSLLKMSGFTNAIIANATQKTVSDILENGSYQSIYMISQLVRCYDGEKNARIRTHMMKHVQTILRVHCPQANGTPGMSQSMRVLEGCLLMGLSDSAKEVKEVSRSCFLIYEGLWPKAAVAMRAKMDAKVKKLLEGVTNKVDGEKDSIAKQMTRTTTVSQSVSTQKAVTGTRSAMRVR